MSDREHLVAATWAASNSEDPSTKVGAVLVGPMVPINMAACNSFLGLDDPATATRQERYDHVVHAEATLMLTAGLGHTRGGSIYCTHEPCLECVKMAITCEVARIVFYSTSPDRRERWKCEVGRKLARAAGLTYVEVPREGEAK